MTRQDFLKTAACAAAAPLMAQTGRRNLIFILSDDHSIDHFGRPAWLKTPGMDRMARGGARFRNSFVTTSLCSPSRASILTGLYVHAHRVTDNVSPFPKGLLTFPELLQKAGYRTGFLGKWHMGNADDNPQPGFDRWVSFRGQGVYNDPLLNMDGVRRQVKGYVTDILTEEALRFIGQNSHRPFFLYLSHKAVHGFCVPAARHRNLYSTEPIPYPQSMANTAENYRGKPDWVRRQRNSWHGVDGMYDHRISFEQNYRDCCRTLMALDESIGQVLNALDEKRLLNDTLVLYMSDNGFQYGEHGLIDKRTMYETSIRVPMLAHCPDLFGSGREIDGMALNIDIAPTLLEAASLPLPATFHGRSLLPLLRGTSEWRTEFLYEYFWERDYPQTPSMLGLRTDRYSYTNYHGVWDLDELYDLQQDPDQMHNLLGDVRITTQGGSLFAQIKDPERKRLVGDLRNRMFRILANTGGRREPTWSA
ncbi:MAG TPA: sulfatase [Bryobacteraceae bacterium]|nr:sulfatase [Bryobacteraceae bacterium]